MATTYKFGPFRLDATVEILFHGTVPTGLGRRAIALLRLLLDRAGEPVPKDALIDGRVAWAKDLRIQIGAHKRRRELQGRPENGFQGKF